MRALGGGVLNGMDRKLGPVVNGVGGGSGERGLDRWYELLDLFQRLASGCRWATTDLMCFKSRL